MMECYQREILKIDQKKTYNSGDSLVVTHRTTNPPVRCLISAEQTGRDISVGLWSYVEVYKILMLYILTVFTDPEYLSTKPSDNAFLEM